jgi:hypothetical protein
MRHLGNFIAAQSAIVVIVLIVALAVLAFYLAG